MIPEKGMAEVCLDIKEKTTAKAIDFQCFVEAVFIKVGNIGLPSALLWGAAQIKLALRASPCRAFLCAHFCKRAPNVRAQKSPD